MGQGQAFGFTGIDAAGNAARQEQSNILAPLPSQPPLYRRPRCLEDVCRIEKGRSPLGKGSFGSVWKATLTKSACQSALATLASQDGSGCSSWNRGAAVAVKALDKHRMREMNVSPGQVANEIALLRECTGNERFVQLLDFVETDRTYYIVLEYCDGGNLENAAKMNESSLGEKQVKRLMTQLLESVTFLHHKEICHRDIKPQNIMMDGTVCCVSSVCNEHVHVKLADFGLAVRLRSGVFLREKVGTPAFMAPEMHLLPARSPGYNQRVDTWAAGAVMVFLLALEYPFVDGCGRLLKDRLLKGDLPIWNTDVFSGLFQRVQEVAGMRRRRPSVLARDLVRQLLNPKGQHRFSAGRALQHEWIHTQKAGLQPTDDLPLLVREDFEAGLKSVESELGRLAADMADVVGLKVRGVTWLEPVIGLNAGALATGANSEYVVEYDGLPVNSEWSRQSRVVAYLNQGTLVKVVEMGSATQGRRRARIADPSGWISLWSDTDEIFAARKDQVACRPCLPQRRQASQVQLQVSHTCFHCGRVSCSLDFACHLCGASLCVACARQQLFGAASLHCPQCSADICSGESVRLVSSAARVSDSLQLLWDGLSEMGRQLISGSAQPSFSAIVDEGTRALLGFDLSRRS
jgi:serine/threonine protein kinase